MMRAGNIKTAALGAASFLLFTLEPSFADPLQGHIERSDSQLRVETPGEMPPVAPMRGSINQSVYPPPVEQAPQLDTTNPNNVKQGYLAAPGRQPLQGSIQTGQDEIMVNWDEWRHRVADAVWTPIRAQKLKIYGQTRVFYNVTRDRHIQITDIFTPDPTGASGTRLADAILRLDGDPVLDFPAGSQQTVHQNVNMALGLPLPLRQGRIIYLPGGNERVFRQW